MMDDVFIHGSTPKEHNVRLEKVLQRLQDAGTDLKPTEMSVLSV